MVHVVNDVEALERALKRKHVVPILFTESGRTIRIWPRGQCQKPMGTWAGLLGWCRDLLVAFQNAMTGYESQTGNVV